MCRNKILGDLNFSYSYNLMNFLVERGLRRGGGRARATPLDFQRTNSNIFYNLI